MSDRPNDLPETRMHDVLAVMDVVHPARLDRADLLGLAGPERHVADGRRAAREHLVQQAPLGRLHDAAPADPVGGERVARDAARSSTVTREPRRPSSIAVTTPARRAPTTTTSLSYPLSLMAGTMPAARP